MDFGKIAKDVMGLGAKPEPEKEADLPDDGTRPAPSLPTTIDATLAQRGSRYGKFTDNSEVFAQFMRMVYDSPAYHEGRLDAVHMHALSNFATKFARLLTGDPNYDDNWRDIAGYATLMVAICNGEER